MDQLESNSMGCGNALAVAQARADVFGRAALIIRAHALLEETISAPATPFRLFLIEVARSRLAKRIATTSTVTDATAFAVNVNDFWLSNLVLYSKTHTALFRATLLIQALLNFGFILLYFTLLYFI